MARPSQPRSQPGCTVTETPVRTAARAAARSSPAWRGPRSVMPISPMCPARMPVWPMPSSISATMKASQPASPRPASSGGQDASMYIPVDTTACRPAAAASRATPATSVRRPAQLSSRTADVPASASSASSPPMTAWSSSRQLSEDRKKPCSSRNPRWPRSKPGSMSPIRATTPASSIR